jgi:pyruvate dehydrogenase E2 component (dihydrolipoamide acetyltransferase)
MPAQARAAGEGDAPEAARIAFQTLGGGGPSALLLHGFGSDHLSWVANQPALGNVATLFALDLPGHGASGMNVGDGAVATLAQRIAARLDQKGLHALNLIGHSLGGGVALVLAATRPDLVASLALIAPAGLGEALDPAFLAAFPELAAPEDAQRLLQRLVVRPRLIGKPLVALALRQLDKPGSRDALRRVAQGLLDGAGDLQAAAGAVAASAIPRLVIWGEEDVINPISRARLVAFGGALLVAPGAAHLPHVESPRFVNAAISDFLTRPRD